MAWNNLGGQGPDVSARPEMRYANVGVTVLPDGTLIHFDLVVTAESEYTPFDVSQNGLNGRFAQINVAANTDVDLRVQVRPSCCAAPNCGACDRLDDATQVAACYAEGCCCFGDGSTVFAPSSCGGFTREFRRVQYGCAQMDVPVSLPGQSLVSSAPPPPPQDPTPCPNPPRQRVRRAPPWRGLICVPQASPPARLTHATVARPDLRAPSLLASASDARHRGAA